MSEPDDLNNMIESAKGSSRHETEPEPTEDTDDALDLPAAVAEALEAIDAGDKPDLVSVRDENLSALLLALDETGQLQPVAEDLADDLDRDATDANRSELVRLAIRHALDDVAPDVLEDAQDGYQQYLTESVDDF